MEGKHVNKKIFSGLLWEGSTKFLIQIASWFSTIVVARLLDPSDYGLVAISGVFTGFLILISELGLAAGLINKKELDESDKSIIFWLGLLLSIVLYIMLFFAAPYISSFYKEPMLVDIIRVAGSMLIFSSLKIIPTAILMRELRFKYTALTHMLAQAANIITVITLAYKGFGAWSLIYAVLVSQVVQIIAFIPVMGGVPKFTLSFTKAKDLILFGATITGSRILGYIENASATFIVATFLGSTKVGYYNMATTIAQMPMDKIGSIFNKVTFPAVSRIKHDKEHASIIFLNLMKYLLIIVIPIFFSIFIAAEQLILLLLTEKWLPIIGILKLLIVMNVFRLSGMLIPSVLEGLGLTKVVFRFKLMSAVFIPSSMLIGVNWGLSGVVISLSLAYPVLFMYLLYVYLSNTALKLSEFIIVIAPPAIGGVVMLLIALLISEVANDYGDLAKTIISLVIALVVYIIILFLFYRKEISEMKAAFINLRT